MDDRSVGGFDCEADFIRLSTELTHDDLDFETALNGNVKRPTRTSAREVSPESAHNCIVLLDTDDVSIPSVASRIGHSDIEIEVVGVGRRRRRVEVDLHLVYVLSDIAIVSYRFRNVAKAIMAPCCPPGVFHEPVGCVVAY